MGVSAQSRRRDMLEARGQKDEVDEIVDAAIEKAMSPPKNV